MNPNVDKVSEIISIFVSAYSSYIGYSLRGASIKSAALSTPGHVFVTNSFYVLAGIVIHLGPSSTREQKVPSTCW